MRFLLAVMAVTVALSLSGAAQKTKTHSARPSSADAKAPKSTAPPPKASASSSKDLQRVENSSARSGHGSQPKKTHVVVAKADRSPGNPSINFNGKGGGNTGNRNPGSLKGRLKQK